MKILDVLGSSLGLVDTLLLVRASIWAWPIGILAILINMVLYFKVMLYADLALQMVYLASSLYGWYYWLWGAKNNHPVPITHITLKLSLILLCLAGVATLISTGLLMHYTHSTTPLWDSSSAILSLVAQWLVCRKIIENWLLWLLIDSLYAGLYYYKGLPFHTLEHCIYLVIALIGYWLWRKKMYADRVLVGDACFG